VFPTASICLEQEEVAEDLRIFWLLLALDERIEWLGSEGQSGLLLQNGGFNGGNMN
jgi:hypothetical protein